MEFIALKLYTHTHTHTAATMLSKSAAISEYADTEMHHSTAHFYLNTDAYLKVCGLRFSVTQSKVF